MYERLQSVWTDARVFASYVCFSNKVSHRLETRSGVGARYIQPRLGPSFCFVAYSTQNLFLSVAVDAAVPGPMSGWDAGRLGGAIDWVVFDWTATDWSRKTNQGGWI